MVSVVQTMGRSTAGARKIDWNPYLAGAGLGVLSWVVFVVVDPLGITTAFSALSGAVAIPFLGADTVARFFMRSRSIGSKPTFFQLPPSARFGCPRRPAFPMSSGSPG